MSVKLTGLKNLIPLSFDVALSVKGHHSVTDNVDHLALLSKNGQIDVSPDHSQIAPLLSRLRPDLIKSSFDFNKTSTGSSLNYYCAKAKHTSEGVYLYSTKVSYIMHKLNSAVSNDLHVTDLSDSDPPAVWTVLSELNYSPSLFNLGLWYEKKSHVTPKNEAKSEQSYLLVAERYYLRAVEADEHPIAAYNLACRLLSTNRSEIKNVTRSYSVVQLMRIAAGHHIKPAQRFIDKFGTT